MRRGFWIASSFFLAVTAACSALLDTGSLQGGAGGSSSSAGTGGATNDAGDAAAGIPLPELAPALAHAVCENLAVCYVSASEIFIHDEDCQMLFTSVITDQIVAPIQQSVMRGKIDYDPTQAAACIMKIVDGTRTSPPTCNDFNAVIEDCKRMLGRLGAAGLPCAHRFECAPGFLCDNAGGCPGRCKRFAQIGAMCAVDGDCDPTVGLYCRKNPDAGTASAGVCQPLVAVNGDCAQGENCVSGALCLEKKCRLVSDLFTIAETFTCYSSGSLCRMGLDCEFSGLPFLSMGTCVKEKNVLDACKVALPDECPKDTYCSANGFNTGGQCVATPVENQHCASDFEQTIGVAAACKATLACVNGICKPMRHLGQPCEVNAQCYSNACGPASLCVPPGCP
jgi:hypothetical protein